MTLISLEALIAIGDSSRRTWWRRISDNPSFKKGTDPKGRTVISINAAREFIALPHDDITLAMLMAADAGDPDSQNDAGLMYSELENHRAAVYWWRAAAEQENADAMQLLGKCYIEGIGVDVDEDAGIMWIARAATHGHIIARTQLKGLRPFIDWRSLELPPAE